MRPRVVYRGQLDALRRAHAAFIGRGPYVRMKCAAGEINDAGDRRRQHGSTRCSRSRERRRRRRRTAACRRAAGQQQRQHGADLLVRALPAPRTTRPAAAAATAAGKVSRERDAYRTFTHYIITDYGHDVLKNSTES